MDDAGQRRDDFVVWIGQGPGGWVVRVTESPEGQSPSAPFDPPFTEAELDRLARRFAEAEPGEPGVVGGRRNLVPLAPPGEESWARVAGERLFHALLPGPLQEMWEKSSWAIDRSEDTGRRLLLRVRFDLAEGVDGAALHRLPWELLFDPERGRFLGLDDRRSVARYLEVARPSSPGPTPRPLVVLAAGSNPGGGAPYLDVRAELSHLESVLGSRVELRRLETTSLEGLRRAVQSETVHVLHFMGHGELDPSTGEGRLILQDDAGRPEPVGSRELLEAIGGRLSATRLVFLNACETAETTRSAPWAGLATALVRQGVVAVVAMTRPITDRAALEFSRAFYSHLAQGGAIDAAVYEGRWAIRNLRSGEWAIPALFLRSDGGPLVRPRESPRRRWRAAAILAVALIAALALGLQIGPIGSERDRPVGPVGPITAERGDVRHLPLGEPVRLPEVGAVVTAELVVQLEQEMVRLTVAPDEGGSAAVAVFPGETAEIDLPLSGATGGPPELLEIPVLTVDRAARTVALRAFRRPAVEG